MGSVLQLLENIMLLTNAMSFYILLGLLIAGIIKQLLPDDYIRSHLGKSSVGSVVKATLLGIPMPVCSCSVIPLAKSLQKEGASKGAVQSFLISTPITGADSIMATYSFFGWFFTIYRVITSIIIAILTGLIQNYIDNKESSINNGECCSVCSCSSEKQEYQGFSIQESLKYAYVTLFKDIYFSLFIGILIGAMFTTFVPKEMIEPLFAYPFLTYIAVLIIAMPLYVCATASLPIAAAFILSGMSVGGAFVFLSAGPATNSVTMGVVASMFGKKSLFIYIGTISILSILFGYLLDLSFTHLELINMMEMSEEYSVVDTISSIILFGLIFYYMARRR